MPILIAIWGLCFFLVVECVVFLPLYILGIPACWLASRHAGTHDEPSWLYPDRTIRAYNSRLLDEWLGNHEDGMKPVFSWWPKEKTALQWFLRNPVGNMRFWPIVSTKPSASTRWVGTASEIPGISQSGWFLAWSGPYAGFRWQNGKWGVWIGWKINPRDARFIMDNDYRNWGLGTALQLMSFKVVR